MNRLYALLAIAVFAVPAAAADAPGWTPNDMLRVKRFGSVVPSPDGRRVAYSVREAVTDELHSEFVSQIYLVDADGGNPVQLTRRPGSADHPQWSPDGKSIAFLSTRTGKTNIFVIPVSGGEAEQLTDVKTAVSALQWAPHGRSIAFTMLDPPTVEEEIASRIKTDVRVIDENVKMVRLYVIPLQKNDAGKRPPTVLSPADRSVANEGFDWHPDGRTIAFSHAKSPGTNDWPTADISLVDVASGKVRPLVNTGGAETAPKYSPFGDRIAYVRSDNPPTWGGDTRVYVVPSEGGTPHLIGDTPDRRPTLFGWGADGVTLYCGEVRGTRSQLYALTPDGKATPLGSDAGAGSAGVHISRNGAVAGLAWENSDGPAEAYVTRLYRYDPVLLTRVNKNLPKHRLGETQVVRWKSSDEKEIEGLLTLPVGFKKGDRVPLLLVIHGGPAGVFTETFIGAPGPYPVAAFASRGYAVLRANPRGSSGYGREFRYANYKDWGGGDYRDLMSGVDHVVKMGVADPDRLGVMGWSYGGFMTSWVVTQTKRFKAASVGAGVTNLVSFTGTADIPGFLPDYLGGEPWDNDALYRERSATFRAKGVTTPTLIQHGANDERVPLSQGLEFYNALKRQGCTTKMVVYPRTPHGINEPRLLLDAMNRNINWFDTYVGGGGPPVAGAAPRSRTEVVNETLHGVEIADPYRWLEDQKSPETRAWIETQQKYTQKVLAPLPGRDAISRRLTELMKTENMSVPSIHGGRFFFSKRSADQDMPVFYVRAGRNGKDEVLLDCNTLSKDKSVSATQVDISNDGKLWVYGLRVGGEDEVTIKFRDVDTKTDLADTLPRGRYFGVQLTADKTAIYFSRMTRDGARVYFRRLGDTAEKEVFGSDYGPDKITSVGMSDDGRYLLLTVHYGSAATKTEVYVKDLTKDSRIVPIVNDVTARFTGHVGGDTLFLQTNWNAPNNRVIAVDLKAPAKANWKEIVPEGKSVLQGIALIDRKLFVSYLENVHSKQMVHTADGTRIGEVRFPGNGTGHVVGRWDQKEAFLNFANFVTPQTTYDYDPDKGIGDVWFRPKVPVKPDDFETKQVRYKSKDGTEIPMFVVHKKGLKLDGSNPVYLTGYGGFNLSRTPAFSERVVLWAEKGGVFALPSLRGGGEFGEVWHKAGMLEKKQNVFDDFIGAAEYLIKEKYTRPEKLAIAGGSNGGLLVGAALTQRPELFKAVICAVPLLDMVRYHRFLVARFWVPEYGSAENANQFKYIFEYSPYHRVKTGTKYPAVMFVTGDADTRVDPLHARKMCALLQAATGSDPAEKPVLLHYDSKAGHSSGKPVSKAIEDLTDEYLFLFWQLGIR